MYFVLTPDALSAVQVKTILAEQQTANVTVGPFQTMLDTLDELWLLPQTEEAEDQQFQQQLRESALALQSAFWSKSLIVDEHAVLHDLAESLIHFYEHLSINKKLSAIKPLLDNRQERASRYLSDLIQLAAQMNDLRPHLHEKAKKWLAGADLPPIQSLQIIVPKELSLPIWQQEVVTKLQTTFPLDDRGKVLQATINELFEYKSSASHSTDWVDTLFKENKRSTSGSDDRLSIISCRDALEECEVLVSRIQQAVSEGVNPDEIAIVTPQRARHQQLLPSLFSQAGITYSNLGNAQEYFEWDKQLLKDLLQLYAVYQDEDAYLQPVQLGSILVNPLMPWSLKFGQRLFEDYQYSDNFNFIDVNNERTYQPEELPALIELLDSPSHTTVSEWLKAVAELLHFKQVPILFSKAQLQADIEEIHQNLSTYTALRPFDALMKMAQQIVPKRFAINDNDEIWYLNSVLMLNEKNILIKPVKHLFIIGFNEGAFEPNLRAPGVFQKDDWLAIQQMTDLDVYNHLMRDNEFEMRFKRFFNQATEGVHISSSEQAFDGSRLSPSQTLIDLAIGLQPLDKVQPLALITPIKTQPRDLAFVEYSEHKLTTPSPIREEPEDLAFDLDLIALHKDSEGNPRTESPSSLDKLMVSPLAWLLDRQGLKEKVWAVQDLPVWLLGTVAHKVFELHFEPTAPYSVNNYEALFEAAIDAEAEFLKSPRWRMERKQLQQETQKALVPFVEWCEQEGWQNEMQEGRLTGEVFSLPIKGFVDAVFKKGDTRLILDYKKSSSKKFVKRLNNGFDLQTMMYRKLIAQKGDTTAFTHSGYFTLNDRTLILDEETPCQVKGLSQKTTTATIHEQSQAAESLILKRIEELRAGHIMLNETGDVKKWDDLGISSATYAIDENPLVSAYMKSEAQITSQQEGEA